MATIPLVALDAKPPANPDVLENYGKLMAIQGQQQQNQQRQAMAPLQQQEAQQSVQTGAVDLQQKQQQLADQKAITASMQQWDGKDYNDIYPLILKNGGSGTAVMGLKKSVLDQQQAIATTAKNNAQASQAQMAADKQRGDLLDGALTPLLDPKQTPDEQLPQALTQTVQQLTQSGVLDPQHAQTAAQLAQLAQTDPTSARQQLMVIQKSNLAHSQIMEDALKGAQTDEATANAGASIMKQYAPTLAQSQNAADYATKLSAFETLHPDLAGRFPQQFDPKNPQPVLSAGMTAPEVADFNQKNALAKYTQANENYRAQLGRQTTFQNSMMMHGLNQVDQYTADPQHGYGQFVAQAGAVKSAIQDAKNGNQLAASMEPMMLALGVSSFAGVHRINTTEIDRAGPAVGSAFRKLNNLFDTVGTGTPSTAQLNEANSIVDQLTQARHDAYVQGVSAVAANTGLDPNKVSVFDQQGNIAPLASLQPKTSSQPNQPNAGGPSRPRNASPLPLPPMGQRKSGQTYKLGNGSTATWDGQGLVPN